MPNDATVKRWMVPQGFMSHMRGDATVAAVLATDFDQAIARAEAAERTLDHERCARIAEHEAAVQKVRDEARKVTDSALRIKTERDTLAAQLDRVRKLPRGMIAGHGPMVRADAIDAALAPVGDGIARTCEDVGCGCVAKPQWNGQERRVAPSMTSRQAAAWLARRLKAHEPDVPDFPATSPTAVFDALLAIANTRSK